MEKNLKKTFNFEKAFRELEGITASLENDVDLDQGLKKFEKGLELARLLKGRLKEMENKVEIIKKKFKEELEEENEPEETEE